MRGTVPSCSPPIDAHVDAMPLWTGVSGSRGAAAARLFVERSSRPGSVDAPLHPGPAGATCTGSRLGRSSRGASCSGTWCRTWSYCWPSRRVSGCRSSGPSTSRTTWPRSPRPPRCWAGAANWQRQVGLLAASTICLHAGKARPAADRGRLRRRARTTGWIGRAVRLGASPRPHATVRACSRPATSSAA